MKMQTINIVGGGLSGCEVAVQLLKKGYLVNLYEMRPKYETGAHHTGNLAELVCSNSLKSTDIGTASGVLKEELKTLDCELLKIAEECSVPGGSALCVDREMFSEKVQSRLREYKNFKLINEKIDDIPSNGFWVLATGPLTTQELISKILGNENLYFYDAIAPIIDFESIDMSKAFFSSRYGKGGDDYLNLPLEKKEYFTFVDALVNAGTAQLKDFEKRELFQGCMPIELIAKTGVNSLRFGPLKPVGITGPNGERYYAVVQARKETLKGDCFNLVGFQTNLKYPEQKRVFSMIPALKNSTFIRYGSMHRNTYINAKKVINSDFSLKGKNNLYVTGQLIGVEGYMESIMAGYFTALSIDMKFKGKEFKFPDSETICGALLEYTQKENSRYQPMNANFGLLTKIDIKNKTERNKAYYNKSCVLINKYKNEVLSGI